jgi:riboflavin synthase
MFTGIIEEVGRISNVSFRAGNRILTIQSSLTKDMKLGDSIAVEGCCLTVIGIKDNTFLVEVTKETLSKTTLKDLKKGDFCNLERAIIAGDRFGGHFVQGHVDEVGRIIKITRSGRNFLLEIKIGTKDRSNIVEKGSIAVSGISLTVSQIRGNHFQAVIIPYTYENTTLKYRRVGDRVNIEYDILGKYAKGNIKRHEAE